MNPKLRIAQVAPVATSIPAPKGGSVESVTALLTEELVARGLVEFGERVVVDVRAE